MDSNDRATPRGRAAQLAYSEIQPKTSVLERRIPKAAKVRAVVGHFLGTDDWSGRVVVDMGCSTGFVVEEAARAGARVIGVDIDEPGIRSAVARSRTDASYVLGDGSALPVASGVADIVVFNHIYEHVVDPHVVMNEIRRILAVDGVVYLGFGNRWQVIEPHHRLPFLSWLPERLADRYVRASGRADSYYERYDSERGLRRLCEGLRLWDYTESVLCDPDEFSLDGVPRIKPATMRVAARCLRPVMPTFLWVGTKGSSSPAGRQLRRAPARIQ